MSRIANEISLATAVVVSFAVSAALGVAGPASATSYVQTNLVTDDEAVLTSFGYAPAAHVDPNLVNPWGIATSATSPFWVSDNGTGLATLYNTGGAPQALVVTIPDPSGGTSAPTGQVFNSTTDFQVGGAKSNFIFATEGGTIAAWNSTQGTTAALEVNNSPAGAVYKGLALGNNGAANFLYAANFNSGHIDVFNSAFAPTSLAGTFTDPSPPPVPAGTAAGQNWAPFNVDNIGGHLFVTYALQNAAKHDDVAGAGNGFIDEFDLNGNFIKRIATGGPLDSPWALDIAPGGFGDFANDLLVGNFGSGAIDAYDLNTDAFLGQLTDQSGNPIVIDGLWALINGNGGSGGALNTVYFSAGINGEADGLFGAISVPEPRSVTLLAMGIGLLGLGRLRRAAR